MLKKGGLIRFPLAYSGGRKEARGVEVGDRGEEARRKKENPAALTDPHRPRGQTPSGVLFLGRKLYTL